MILSRYLKKYPTEADPASIVFFSTKRASTVILPESMLADIEHGNITEEEKETLIDLGFLANAGQERNELLHFMHDLNGMNTKFYAKIVMNLDCNLDCTYCFEGQRKGQFYMTKKTADDFIEFIKNKVLADKEEIILSFYGGEPLMSADLIVYIAEQVKAATETQGISFSSHITTNGTLLTPKNVERLETLGLKEAAVTIDGPKSVHDLFRPFKRGKGSFDTIMRNVKDVCSMVRVQIGGNFTRENYREMPALLDYMMVNGLTPDKVPLVRFDPVVNERADVAPPEFHDGCQCINEPWIYEAGLFLREEIMKRGYSSPSVSPLACMMEIRDRLVLNYDGSIYKCPGLIGRGEFCVGDIWNGIRDYRKSHNLDNWKNEECLNCAYLPLCFGGCRYMKYIRDGNMHGVDCRKPYFDATLEALVKQDIKYGPPAS
jgi:uncharacterized protein